VFGYGEKRERARTWMLLLLLWVEKTELEMIIGNESNSETECSESGKASQLNSCKRLREKEITGCVNKIEAPRQNHPSIITVSFNSIPDTPDETVQQTEPFPNPC
jgi:hypothetical protein